MWMQYVKDTLVVDVTPPPPPANIEIDNRVITWQADADLQSGIKRFLIMRDGQIIASAPDTPKNKFGRPIFQGLQYSDTPVQPLSLMQYIDEGVTNTSEHRYQVISENTLGLRSPPSF